jgi:RHS repeat-associated protein
VRGLASYLHGTAVKRYSDAPWGDQTADTGLVVRFRFAGREYDQRTGLYYMRARYYDPQMGRFLSEDPIGIAGGLNLYAYAEDEPVNQSDPLGLARPGSIGFYWHAGDVTVTACRLGSGGPDEPGEGFNCDSDPFWGHADNIAAPIEAAPVYDESAAADVGERAQRACAAASARFAADAVLTIATYATIIGGVVGLVNAGSKLIVGRGISNLSRGAYLAGGKERILAAFAARRSAQAEIVGEIGPKGLIRGGLLSYGFGQAADAFLGNGAGPVPFGAFAKGFIPGLSLPDEYKSLRKSCLI